MPVLGAIIRRYSCRSYQEKDVEREKLDELFEAARLAPSAKNMQDWRFVAVTEKQTKEQLAGCTNRPEVFKKAGAIIAACSNSDYVMRCGQAAGLSMWRLHSNISVCRQQSWDCKRAGLVLSRRKKLK